MAALRNGEGGDRARVRCAGGGRAQRRAHNSARAASRAMDRAFVGVPPRCTAQRAPRDNGAPESHLGDARVSANIVTTEECINITGILYQALDSPLRWGASDKIGTIQRRLAWPLRKDDTHKSRMVFQTLFAARSRAPRVHFFCPPPPPVARPSRRRASASPRRWLEALWLRLTHSSSPTSR